MQDPWRDTTINKDCSGFIRLSDHAIQVVDLNSILPDLPDPDFGRGNTCIVPAPGGQGYLLNIRSVNYRIDHRGIWYLANHDGSLDSQNELVFLDKSFCVLQRKLFAASSNTQDALFRGLEDVRLLEICTEPPMYYYCASYQTPQRTICISTDFYPLHSDSFPVRVIQSPLGISVEKNWAMFLHRDSRRIMYVYRWHPFQVGVVDHDKTFRMVHETEYPHLPFLRFVKNSSTGVLDPQTNEMWFLVHTHCDNNAFRQYYHAFLIIDASTFALRRVGKCFTFQGCKIEYCLGFVLEKDGVVLTYTTFDQTPRILKVDRAFVDTALFFPNDDVIKY